MPPDVQDLSKLGVPQQIGVKPASSDQIIEKAYDPTADRETIRGTIAQALVWTLVAVIAAVVLTGLVIIVACHVKDSCSDDTVELKTLRAVVELVFMPLIGLVGAVTGFYFGEKSTAGKPAG